MFEETILKEKENYIRGLEQKVRDLNHEIWNECNKLSKMKILMILKLNIHKTYDTYLLPLMYQN